MTFPTLSGDRFLSCAGSGRVVVRAAALAGQVIALLLVAFAGAAHAAPTISMIAPSNGPTSGGTKLTIAGANFSATGNLVTVDSVDCTVVSEGTSVVQCTIPAGTGATNPVQVVDSQGTASNPVNFAYDPPHVTSLTPSNGPRAGGTALTIAGSNFGPPSADSVRSAAVGANPCSVVPGLGADSLFVCTTPAGHGSADVTVTVDGQTDSFATFQYDPTRVDSVSPTSGPTAGNVPITIRGQNFLASGNSATVGGSSCAISNEEDTKIVCTLPPGTGAAKSVAVTAGAETSSASLFDYSPPSLTSLMPGNGPTAGGVTLTILGDNFGAASSDSVRSVTIGTAACALAPGMSNDAAIQCSVPPGQGLGRTVNVLVDGQAASTLTFDYDAPSVTTIAPTPVPTAGGVPLTIHGDNFGLSATVTVGGSSCPVTSQAHTTLECTVPAGSGASVAVDVAVSGQHAAGSVTYRDVVCGDGFTDPGETCDDHNVAGLDGCSAACESEHTEDKFQAACIVGLNAAGAGVAKAEAAAIGTCAKKPVAGVACVGVTPSKAVDSAIAKTASTFDKKCALLPDFGPVAAAEVSSLSAQEELALAHDLFGSDADEALAPDALDPARAPCQRAVLKAWDKLAAASLKSFGKCKKAGLKAQTIRAASQLGACLAAIDADPAVSKPTSAVFATLTDSCAGVDLAAAFPGVCAGLANYGDCIEARVRCRTCRTLAATDHFPDTCDVHDNGTADGSCP